MIDETPPDPGPRDQQMRPAPSRPFSRPGGTPPPPGLEPAVAARAVPFTGPPRGHEDARGAPPGGAAAATTPLPSAELVAADLLLGVVERLRRRELTLAARQPPQGEAEALAAVLAALLRGASGALPPRDRAAGKEL